MMKKLIYNWKRGLGIGIVAAFGATPSLVAEVTPVVIALHGSGTGRPASYTVPSGKTLVLQHYANETTIIPIATLTVGGVASTLQLKSIGQDLGNSAANLGFESFYRPVHIPAGGQISLLANHVMTFFGMLADSGDLYVSNGRPVKTTIQAVGKNGDYLDLKTKIDPPKPAVLMVERSTDLKNFTADGTAEVTSVSSSRKDVKIDTNGEEKLYARVKGRMRENR